MTAKTSSHFHIECSFACENVDLEVTWELRTYAAEQFHKTKVRVISTVGRSASCPAVNHS